MSKKPNKKDKTSKKMVQKTKKADGTDEYYITTAPPKNFSW